MTPLSVRLKISNETVAVPCGKCPLCVKRRQSAWSFRLMQEDKVSISSHFVTLTYDTSKVPITRNGFMTCRKKDIQDFMKRLRKAHEKSHYEKPIKYYLVAEYGGRTQRPHYHAIIFNADITLIQNAWAQGQIHYGQVTGASVGYTLKYMSKKGKIPMHRNDDRLPEFGLMSKGLGQSYISEKMVTWHLADGNNRMYCNIEDGKKISMPRYYKNKIYGEEQRKQIGLYQRQRMEEALERERKEIGCDYERAKAEAVKQAFKKMSDESKRGDKL